MIVFNKLFSYLKYYLKLFYKKLVTIVFVMKLNKPKYIN